MLGYYGLIQDFRRIENSYLSNFTQQLLDDINNGLLDMIVIGGVKNSSIENYPVQHFART